MPCSIEWIPAPDGPLDAFGAVSVRGDVEVVVLRCFDDCPDFFFGELRILPAFGDAQYASGRRDLDQVGALFVALPHGFLGVFDAIDHTFLRPRIAHHVPADATGPVGMTARRGQRLTGVEDMRPINEPLADRSLQ